jgi:ubiquinone/menaquinone biosynthesis C-methylase UbiE
MHNHNDVRIKKSGYICAKCGDGLVREADNFTCQGCGSAFMNENGVLCAGNSSLDLGSERGADLAALVDLTRTSGWGPGFKKFIKSAKSPDYWIRIMCEERAAFTFLFDFMHHDNVLNIDTLFGTSTISLAARYRNVYSYHVSKPVLECVANRVDDKKLKNISLIRGSSISALPFTDCLFDAVVLHNIEDFLGVCGDRNKCGSEAAELEALLADSFRVLKPTGFVFLSFKNKHGEYVMNRGYDEKRYFSMFYVQKVMNKIKKMHKKLFIFFPGIVFTEEIADITNGKYSYERQSSVKEFIKKIIMNNRNFKYIAPGIGMILSGEQDYSSLVEAIIADYRAHSKKEMRITGKRFLVGSAHTLIIAAEEMETGTSRKRGIIIRIPLNEEGRLRCGANYAMLLKLNGSAHWISDKVPSAVSAGKFQDQHYFIESEIPGISLTLKPRIFSEVMERAVDFLLAFHKDTLKIRTIEKAVYAEVFEKKFIDLKELVNRNDLGGMDKIDTIEQYVHQKTMGREFPFVLVHGDYKIDNLILSQGNLKIQGLIDWDLADENGFPLLDFFYLLAYNYMLFQGKDFARFMTAKLIPLEFDAAEAKLYQRYNAALNLPEEAVFTSVIMFWLQHILYREGGDFKISKQWWQTNYYPVLDVLAQRCGVFADKE